VTRKPLTREEIDKNAETYKQQVFRILDDKATEVRYNSEWLDKLGYAGLIGLSAKVTLSQMLDRKEFLTRFRAEQDISLHELLYPLAQGYDSVALNSDVELGGTDQKFNLLMGRELQRDYGQKPQIVLMTPILEGLDGVQKMSKSLGNAIGINEPPAEMYGKLMSISDELMWKYWVFLTDLRQSEVDALRAETTAGNLHPMEVKKRLAWTITAGFHGEAAAVNADENWARMFQQKETAEDLEEVAVAYADVAGPEGSRQVRLPKLLVQLGLAASWRGSQPQDRREGREAGWRGSGERADFICRAACEDRSPAGKTGKGCGDRLGFLLYIRLGPQQNCLRERDRGNRSSSRKPIQQAVDRNGRTVPGAAECGRGSSSATTATR